MAGRYSCSLAVIIPALNEEEPIAEVVRACLGTGLADEIIVVDNVSSDRTAERARAAGARVVSAPRGYGRACAAVVARRSPPIPLTIAQSPPLRNKRHSHTSPTSSRDAARARDARPHSHANFGGEAEY